MSEKYGVILLDENEYIFRIYEIGKDQWKLIHYIIKTYKQSLPDSTMDTFSSTVADFFASDHAQHIAEWKACSRSAPAFIPKLFQELTGIQVEIISKTREQELLSKGIFTEFW